MTYYCLLCYPCIPNWVYWETFFAILTKLASRMLRFLDAEFGEKIEMFLNNTYKRIKWYTTIYWCNLEKRLLKCYIWKCQMTDHKICTTAKKVFDHNWWNVPPFYGWLNNLITSKFLQAVANMIHMSHNQSNVLVFQILLKSLTTLESRK